MTSMPGVALVSETLRHILVDQASAAVDGTTVEFRPPSAALPVDGSPTISLFLYSINRVADARNMDLPVRNNTGELIQPTTLPVELDYLISFTGRENSTDAERLAGATMAAFQAEPTLTTAMVSATIGKLGETDLRAADLELPAPILPLDLSFTDCATLWSMFGDVSFRVSLQYRVRATMALPELLLDAAPTAAPRVAAMAVEQEPRASS